VVNKPAASSASQEIDHAKNAGSGCEFIVRLPHVHPERKVSSIPKGANSPASSGIARRS